ncbi:FadR family transcriptional regulator [Planomonospora sp. ID91781]|uniref:FadR/GntR family transcriptional regulator n=1 Tax=Planomonospora sp. ID91781 TaxID=2738135 RepID=UPI0018C38441|nr:FCD domain-containing protein [Planomonospora sp. ID91781]MBG0824861.1 FadR family transcriptional regulator [Planomonospora sp. ID91781]
MGWEPVRRTRAFEDVIAQIERRIAEDGLVVGDRLPGERQLAEQLRVGRSSVREALRVLETLGVVASQAGRGPDAGAVLTARPAAALADLLRLHVGLSSLSMREVAETRMMIEQWAVRHAAGNVTPGHLDRLRAALARMDRAGSADEFVLHDAEFHLTIAELAGNRLLAATMHALRATVQRHAVEAVERLGVTDPLMDDHRRIYEAVASGDAEEAAAAIADHLTRAYPDLRDPEHPPGPAGAPGSAG